VNKQAPSFGRIFAMVAFALSCFGLLLFLWLTFGGSVPLKAQGFRFKVAFPEAATLAQEADVRLAGVNVGKVKTKELDAGANRTIVTLELDDKYAPLPADSRAILRQKTLLGETYVEISPGTKDGPKVEDGGTLANSQVEDTTQLDEIYDAFDKPTRDAFREWIEELSATIEDGRGEDLNDALGNLSGVAVDGARLFKVLDEQNQALKATVKNTGVVFGAINEQQGALRELVVNANNTFEATASRDEALSDTFAVFPTFLDESKATLARLQRFASNTRPLVNDLKGPADDLAPTLRALGDLSPDLEQVFRDLDPLIRSGRKGLPALTDVLREGEPLFAEAFPFFQELSPILAYFNFHQQTVAGFLSNGAANLHGTWGTGERVQRQVAIIDPRSFEEHTTRPHYERGNAYLAPNAIQRATAAGTFESFDCNPSGGELIEPKDASGPGPAGALAKEPPCLIAPPSLFNGQRFVRLSKGRAPNVPAPKAREGSEPACPLPNAVCP